MSLKYEFWRDEYWAVNWKHPPLGTFKEYIKENIIMVVLKKANAHSVVICRLIKNK